ncbi:MAG: adenylate cyclase [Candidatus Melainabacteria bacterium]|nr:adenylate cyclase [Candidatus Melainabacteria bacterium]
MKINKTVFSEIIKIQLQNRYKTSKPEIERRFLVKDLPKDLGKGTEVIQGYLKTDDGTSVRLRKAGDKYFYTVKVGTGKIRNETEIEISAYLFNSLWHLTNGRRLRKTRYEIPYKYLTIQLDIYQKKLKGLLTVEVEFKTLEQCDNFIPPDWFDEEVTEIKSYTNRSFAKFGIPKGTPLHNTKKYLS